MAQATHIHHSHLRICVGCQYCSKKSWSGHTWEDHFKSNYPGITRDDHYGPPLDLADVKLEEVDAINIWKISSCTPRLGCLLVSLSLVFHNEFPTLRNVMSPLSLLTNYYQSWSILNSSFLLQCIHCSSKTYGYTFTQEIVYSFSSFYYLQSHVTFVIFIKDK